MKKKKILNFAIIFVILALFSVIIEFLIFNFKYIFLVDNKGIIDISDKIIYNEKDNNNEIEINLVKKTYINKLKMYYKVSDNLKIELYVDNNDPINDTLNSLLNNNTINLDKKVKKIIISYPNNIDDIKIKSIKIDNNLHISYVRIIFIFSILLCGLILYKFYKTGGKNDQFHKIFFILFIIIGTNLIIIQPNTCYYSYDDQIHYSHSVNLINFRNKLSLSDKYSISYKNFDDINSFDDVNAVDKLLNNLSEENEEIMNIDSNLYNKIGYAPSALGLLIGRLFHLPYTICFKLGKIFNLLSYGLIMMYAIKKVKIGKRLLSVIAFLPSSLYLSANYSYDPAVIAGFTLAFVLLLNVFVDKNEKIDFKWMCIFLFSLLYGSFVKAVYVPVLLLLLFIPKDRFKNNKICKYIKIMTIVIFMLVLATFVLPSVNGTLQADVRGGNTSVTLQLHHILSNPFNYLLILKNTMVELFFDRFLCNGTLGGMGYATCIKGNLAYILLGLLLFTWITDDNDNEINFKFKTRLLFFINIITIILLIWTALYLSFTPVGLNTISGVQPRYFIPLLFPLLITFKFLKIKNHYSQKLYNTCILSLLCFINFIMIYNSFVLSFGV